MTVSVTLGLLLQAVAVLIAATAAGDGWWRRFGPMFLMVAALYHGFTELMQWAAPGRNPYRALVTQRQIDDWVLLASGAMLAVSIGYAFAMRNQRHLAAAEQSDAPRLPFILLAAISLPLLFLTVRGYGAVAPSAVGGSLAPQNDYVTGGLALQFLVITLALACIALLSRTSGRFALVVLATQALALSLAGARSMVLASTILVLIGLAQYGIRLSARKLLLAACLITLLGASISASRAEVGRAPFAAGSDFGDRVSALEAGVGSLTSPHGRDAVYQDVIYRFDGNTFGSLVLESLRYHSKPVGRETVTNDLRVAVPSFIDPNKLTRPLGVRNEEFFFVERFGLTWPRDYLPGVLGILLGYGGPAVMLGLALFIGVALGMADRRLGAPRTVLGFVLGLGLAYFILFYEQGVQGLPIAIRGVVVLGVVVSLVNVTHESQTSASRQSESSPVVGIKPVGIKPK